MSLIRRNPKRDSTEKECRSYLQARGAVVIPLSGPGLPDLLVGWRGRWLLLECKSPGGHLTERQEEFFAQAYIISRANEDRAAAAAGNP